MSNELKDLRIMKQIPAKDMVAVVQELYPKYDKTVQSKCENGEAYGIALQPDALQALYEHFAPDVLEARARSRHGKHRLTCKIMARLETDVYEALQLLIKADGYNTVQDWLTDVVQCYIVYCMEHQLQEGGDAE